ncbi:hypothetical protein IPM62_00065 [Candidatus Woesebacteria bacterium]|nr:MAG: hypothetical protein IPM62_00065 [Candidatus Woesebacteria bacterium]
MTDALTARQTQILKALIDEYIEVAYPVGSEALEKKYDLGVSPATIRNEMMALTSMGYLKQPHTSAGRIPTPKAMKFYIDQLMEEKQMSLTDEVKAKEGVWDARKDVNSLLREAVHSLAVQTDSLAIAAIDQGRIWHSGYAHIFSNPEFADMNLCLNIFSFLEEASQINEVFFKKATGRNPVEVIFGEDLGFSGLAPISIVITTFHIGDSVAALGVIGPTRIKYHTVIPTLRYFGNLIQEIAGA